jgi:hypothetical protein
MPHQIQIVKPDHNNKTVYTEFGSCLQMDAKTNFKPNIKSYLMLSKKPFTYVRYPRLLQA